MVCMSPFRIDIFFIEILICVLLCEHDIICALRWGVFLIRAIFIRHCSSRRGTPFQVQVMCRWLTLIWDRMCEEDRLWIWFYFVKHVLEQTRFDINFV